MRAEQGLASAPWYRRMLGPTSLSWQVIIFAGIVNFPQMVLTGGNLGARTVQPGEYPTIAAISAATILVSFLYGYLGHKTLFRNRQIMPVSLTTFLIFYAGGGLVYAFGIQVSDAVSGSPSSIPILLRAIDAMLVSISWGIAVSLILDGRNRFRADRDALVHQLVEEKERSEAQSTLIAEGDPELSSAINEELNRHLTAIHRADEHRRLSSSSPPSVRELARKIDSAADIAARESSHRAWEQSIGSTAAPRLGRTLRMALTTPRVWPALMAVLITIGVPTVAVRNFGLWWGLPATIVLGVVAWGWLRLVKKYIERPWPMFALSFFGAAAVVIAFAVVPAPLTPQVPGEIGSILVGLIGGFILVSFVATLQSERAQVLETLATSVIAEEADRLAQARAVAQVARQLHGPVQSRLRVCAIEIEQAADRGDSQGVDVAVDAAMRALAQALNEERQPGKQLSAALGEVAQRWAGFVEVTVQMDSDARLLQGRSDIEEIVNEAIANSHHHGHATAVSVAVTCETDGIHLDVADNGSAKGVGEPGLGMRLLRSMANDFDLTVTDEGACLHVVLPRSRELVIDQSV